jgi:hypothetical protein
LTFAKKLIILILKKLDGAEKNEARKNKETERGTDSFKRRVTEPGQKNNRERKGISK